MASLSPESPAVPLMGRRDTWGVGSNGSVGVLDIRLVRVQGDATSDPASQRQREDLDPQNSSSTFLASNQRGVKTTGITSKLCRFPSIT